MDEKNDISNSEDAEVVYSVIVLLFTFLISITLIITYTFNKLKFYYIQMPTVATLLGIFFGAIFRYDNYAANNLFQKVLTLNENFFFVFLLPPIIFEGGVSITRKSIGPHFFTNMGTIILFATICTTISLLFIGSSLYFLSFLNFFPSFSLKESFSFGALVSSTDPVSIIAIFKEFSPNKTIHALVMGESFFNDAISIVLYRSIVHQKSFEFWTIFYSFIINLLISFIIGLFTGLSASFIYKQLGFYKKENPSYEIAILLLFPWTAYCIADSFNFSGIVAICICGVTMGMYTFPNLSEKGRELAHSLSTAISLLAEIIAFLFLGLGVFSLNHSFNFNSYSISFVILSLARSISVYLTSAIANIFRENKITSKFKIVLIISGLRGVIAFALAERASYDFASSNGSLILSITLFYSIFTTIFLGIFVYFILKWLNIFSTNAPTQSEMLNLQPINQHSSEFKNNENINIQEHQQVYEISPNLGRFKSLLLILHESVMNPFFKHSEGFQITNISSFFSNSRRRGTQYRALSESSNSLNQTSISTSIAENSMQSVKSISTSSPVHTRSSLSFINSTNNFSSLNLNESNK